jgi:putative hydrolase of the HAD superfamily
MPRLRAALVDVGGTLWPDGSRSAASPQAVLRRLAVVLPGAGEDLLERLHEALEVAVARFSGELVQDTDALVSEVATRLGLRLDDGAAPALRRAMNEPAVGVVNLFAGGPELLRTLRDLGLRTVIVSNAFWRDAEAYRRDFEDLGVAGLLDGVVSSVDLGRRKPDPAMFRAGLELAGCGAGESVMIGNMEEKDVLPALALGMRAIRVDIGGTAPLVSAAGATVTSLEAAAAVVRAWVEEG